MPPMKVAAQDISNALQKSGIKTIAAIRIPLAAHESTTKRFRPDLSTIRPPTMLPTA